MSIFKAYDIRGVYPDEFDEKTAHDIACAFMQKFRPAKVVVGHDARPHSPPLFKAFLEGLMEQGAHVSDIGLTTTPMMYFTTANFGFDAGLMITASHNPARYNGVKMVAKGGVPIGGETGIYEIGKMMGRKFTPAKERGTVAKFAEAKAAYVKKELSYVDPKALKAFHVVIDTGNGMGGLIAPDVFAQTPCTVTPLFFELDCSFPNHEANPLKNETLTQLQAKIQGEKADCGIALDGDADRIFMIDEHGERVPADILAATLMPEILRRYPKSRILANVTCSWVVKEEVERAGGVFAECPVGHSLIKAQMRREGAAFAAEVSGHFFFQSNSYLETPFAIALLTLERMTKEGKTLSELVAPCRRYFSTGELNFQVKDKHKAIADVETEFSSGAKHISRLDGVRVEFDDWWFNVRPSNTEPLLRLNLEAKTKERMAEMRDRIVAVVQRE